MRKNLCLNGEMEAGEAGEGSACGEGGGRSQLCGLEGGAGEAEQKREVGVHLGDAKN